MSDARDTDTQRDPENNAEPVHAGDPTVLTHTTSPKTQRPPLPHKDSASTDSRYSSFSASQRHSSLGSTSRAPLSPPLPPASFNPVPDTHPLLLAATASHSSNGSSGSLPPLSQGSPRQQVSGLPSVVSPLVELPPHLGLPSALGPYMTNSFAPSSVSSTVAPTPPRRISASSSLSANTPNSTSSAQSSPFQFAEYQNDVGPLQRRLSQERRRRSSGHSSLKKTFGSSERLTTMHVDNPEDGKQAHAEHTDGATGETHHHSAHDPTCTSPEKGAFPDTDHTGMDHLRGARQELQAVLEEALAEIPAVRGEWEQSGDIARVEAGQKADIQEESQADIQEESQADDPTPLGFQHGLAHQHAKADSALASTPVSPSMSRASDAQTNPPLSFEDLVRHRRRSSSSASGQSPLINSARSGPTSPVPHQNRSRVGSSSENFMDSLASRTRQAFVPRPSPPAAQDDHSPNQLTMMRRAFSGDGGSAAVDTLPANASRVNASVVGQDMVASEPLAPGSILSSPDNGESHNTGDAYPTTPLESGELLDGNAIHDLGSAIREIKLGDRTDESESYTPTTSLDALSAEKRYRSRSNSRSTRMPHQPDDSYPSTPPDSDQPHDTHLWDSVWPSATARPSHATFGHVPYPKPISETRHTLTPRLPMHSRTMSMGMGAQTHPVPMIHSLSFPLANQPLPTRTMPHSTTGVPLSFSAAMSQASPPCPWPQHPSARRGSIASLGVWPLKRDAGTAAKTGTGDGEGKHGDRGKTEDESVIPEEGDGGEGEEGALDKDGVNPP